MQTAPALIPVSLPVLEGPADHAGAAARGCATEFSLSLADFPRLPHEMGDPSAPELVPALPGATLPNAALAHEAGAVRAMCLECAPDAAVSRGETGNGDGAEERTADLASATFLPSEIAVVPAVVPAIGPAAWPVMSETATEVTQKSGAKLVSAAFAAGNAEKSSGVTGPEASEIAVQPAGPGERGRGPEVVSRIAEPGPGADLASAVAVAPVGRKDMVAPNRVDLVAGDRVGHSEGTGRFAARGMSANEPVSDAALERGHISAGGVGAAPQESRAPVVVTMATSGPEVEDRVQDGAALSKPNAGQPLASVRADEKPETGLPPDPDSERPVFEGLPLDLGPAALRTEVGARPGASVALHHKADVATPSVPSDNVLAAGQGDAGPEPQPGSFWERLYSGIAEEPARLVSRSGSFGPAPAILPPGPMVSAAEDDTAGWKAFEAVRGVPVAGESFVATRSVTSRMPAVSAPSLDLAGPVSTFAQVAGDTEIVPEDQDFLPGLPMTSGNPSISVPTTSGPPNALSVPQIASQLATALLQGADGAIELALSPEELGHVRLRLEPDANNPDRLVVMISFERPETLDLFRRHATELAEALRAAGYAGADIGFGQQGSSNTADRRDGYAGDEADFPTDPPPADAYPPRLMAGTSLDLRL